jgi:hypothetical protein
MSLRHVIKELRNLTYNEMMELAQALDREIEKKTGSTEQPNVIAEILAKLNIVTPELSDVEKNEAKFLQEIFNRKRSITVKWDKGFAVSCDSLPAGGVVGVDLRPMFGQLLDQLVTMHALQRMK